MSIIECFCIDQDLIISEVVFLGGGKTSELFTVFTHNVIRKTLCPDLGLLVKEQLHIQIQIVRYCPGTQP